MSLSNNGDYNAMLFGDAIDRGFCFEEDYSVFEEEDDDDEEIIVLEGIDDICTVEGESL